MLYDKDIREPLFDFLDETYGKNRIFEEKMIGASGADVVMVTEQGLFGIEIKSDADTYTRLKSQVKDYDRFYNYNIIVCGSTHGQHVAEHVPEHWGIITVEEIKTVTEAGQSTEASQCAEECQSADSPTDSLAADFYYYRKPQPNPNYTIRNQLTILWRPELAVIQEKFALPKYKQKSKLDVQNMIYQRVPEELLQAEIITALFDRDYTTIADKIQNFRSENNLKKRRSSVKTGVKRKRRRAKFPL